MSVLITQNLILNSGGLDLNAGVIGWHNLVTIENIVADSEEVDHPARLMSNAATTYFWRSASTVVQYVTITTPSDVMMDYVGIARHNFGSAKVRVSVEKLVTGVWTEVFPPFIPTNDAPLLLRFAETLGESMRLKLEPTDGIVPRCAVVYLGKLLVLQRRIYVGHTPLPYGRETDFTNNVAENGDFQGRVELKRRLETTVSLLNLTPSWYRDQLDWLLRYTDEGGGRSLPFFFAWRPLTYSSEVGYAWLTNNPKPTNQRSNGMMQINLSMAGLVL